MAELKRHEVTLEARVTLTRQILADTPELALAAAMKNRPLIVRSPNFRPTSVGDHEVAGQCEACEAWLLDGTDYASDDEGCLLCMPCATEAVEAKGERLRERGL